MQREMRRKNQVLPVEENLRILRAASHGVLAVLDPEGWPYTVPLSFAYQDGSIFFHCAGAGHKLDAIRAHERVSFCVIEKDEIVPDEFTTYFRSVIAFGRAHLVEEPEKKRRALEMLIQKYAPDAPGAAQEIAGAFHRVQVVEIQVEKMTGKEARELMEARKKASALGNERPAD